MSANTFTRQTISGDTQHTRKGTQGRHAISAEFRKVKFSARIMPHTLSRVSNEAKKYGMTESKYADLALALFEITDYVGQEFVNT